MTDWPRRFIYVCNATQAAIVNALPIVSAGLDRISDVVIFVGAPEDPRLRDVRHSREAIEPANHLQAAIASMGAGRGKGPRIKCYYGDAGRFSDWARHMRAIIEDAESKHSPVVLNLSGGTKMMSIGALTGGRSRPLLITVGGAPLRTEFLIGVDQQEAPRHGELPLGSYLSIYGLQEINSRQREATEHFYQDYASHMLAFGDLLTPQSAALVPLLFRLTKHLRTRDGDFTPGLVEPNSNTENGQSLAEALQKLVGMPGIEADSTLNQAFRITTGEAANFLRGRWLEAYAYLKLLDEYRGRNDVSVAANVCLRHSESRDDALMTRGEIDVALMIRSQLHIIEAKTARFVGRDQSAPAERSLAQLESLKRNLLGQFGRVFVINPTDRRKWLASAPGDFLTRAQAAGIDLLLGSHCVTDLIGWVRKL
jgi:hypothetical protein